MNTEKIVDILFQEIRVHKEQVQKLTEIIKGVVELEVSLKKAVEDELSRI